MLTVSRLSRAIAQRRSGLLCGLLLDLTSNASNGEGRGFRRIHHRPQSPPTSLTPAGTAAALAALGAATVFLPLIAGPLLLVGAAAYAGSRLLGGGLLSIASTPASVQKLLQALNRRVAAPAGDALRVRCRAHDVKIGNEPISLSVVSIGGALGFPAAGGSSTSLRLVLPVLDDGGGVRAHLALTAHEAGGRFSVSEAILVHASGAKEDAMDVFGGELNDDDIGGGGGSGGPAFSGATGKWKRGGRVVEAEWRES
jgi:hypothetical protein